MGADFAANFHCYDGSDAQPSSSTSCSNFRWAARIPLPDRLSGAPQLVPFYRKMFSLYGNTSGTPLAILGCPFNADGSRVGRSSEWQRLRESAKRVTFQR